MSILEDRTAKLITFGRGGDVVYYGSGCHTSGYGSPDRPHAADPTKESIHDGCPVIDKTPALETQAGISFVISGPMVDVDLEPGSIDRCPEPSAVLSAGVEGGFKTLLALQGASRKAERRYGPLDCVDTATYISLWRDLGARIGTVESGSFVWEK